MQKFYDLGFWGQDLYKLNICCIHLQIITIADITDGIGERVLEVAWNGKQSTEANGHY
jgi:hypothetical protein